MAQYFPNDSSRLGATLLTSLNTEDPLGIPVWQLCRRQVPIISTLALGNPSMRLISFVGSNTSPTMSTIMSSVSCMVPHLRHNILGASLSFYNNVEDSVPEDQNLNKEGLPVELGVGCLVNFNFASTDRNPLGNLGVSFPVYEITMSMIKVLCYLKNHQLLSHTYQCDMDMTVAYEPACHTLTRSTINDSELMEWNDSYESVTRYMCGSDQLPFTSVLKKMESLVDSFFEVTTELNTDPTITTRKEDMDRNHQSFRLHRIVSRYQP